MLTLLPDLNVAPLKYAHVHREHGGPVHSLSFVERSLPEGVFYEAFAHLESACARAADGPHGRAFAAAKADAIHGAISDAMAFWAWTVASRDHAAALRLDLDATRFGFAAFPGLGVQGAHKRALFAAAEKWNLCSWWEGQLAHAELKAPGVTAIQLRSPIVGVSTVITWEPHGEGGNFGVATAAAPSLAHASARLNMLRNRERLTTAPSALPDWRHRFFSGSAGFGAFQSRLAAPGPRMPPTPPKLVVDAAVQGPWLQYAHVWRCLYDYSPFREKEGSDEYFLF